MIRLQLSNGWHQPNMCILALAIGQKWIHNQKIQRYYTNIVHPYLQRDAIMWIIQKYQENPRFVITIIKEASQMSSETSSGLHSTTDCLWVIQVEIPDDLDERVRSQSILIIRRGATFLFDFFCITALQCITLKQKKKKNNHRPFLCLLQPGHSGGKSKLISISRGSWGDIVEFRGCFGLQGGGMGVFFGLNLPKL